MATLVTTKKNLDEGSTNFSQAFWVNEDIIVHQTIRYFFPKGTFLIENSLDEY